QLASVIGDDSPGTGDDDCVDALAFRPQGGLFAIGHGTAFLRDATGKERWRVPLSTVHGEWKAAVTPDGLRAVDVGLQDSSFTVRSWDLETGRYVVQAQARDWRAGAIAPDATRVAIQDSSSLRVVNARTGSVEWTRELAEWNNLALLPDGSVFACGARNVRL